MTRVIRITRHEPAVEQIEALQTIFGPDVDISTVSETLPSEPREAVKRFDELAKDADVVEAVLPINLLEAVLKFSEFSKRGGLLIRAVMNREVREDGKIEFTFDHYEIIEKVEVVTQPLKPEVKG